ncbi:MAG TPA: MOSC N-terminal beta barrel domain-containing protein [Burkholderiaceae bacterium]|nr:MOSC N-terminal beta barrel domain-containing protein [Burkholderiaceae bacterium]
MSAVISRLLLYPVKGCRGLALRSVRLAPTGLALGDIGDREWVVVDDQGEFLSQRELPRMALIETKLGSTALRLSAPGMPTLDIPFESAGDVMRVRVWDDELDGLAQGELADRWCTDFLGHKARLIRFDARARRLSQRRYTGATAAPYKFADAFALLVTSEGSLADVNKRLHAKGQAPVDIDRFRPNIVIDGVDRFEEDYARELRIGDAVLELVKPCVRCTVPSVDPTTGEQGTEPGDTLAVYRNNSAAGGVTFGMNAIVARGAGTELRVGDPVELTLRF